MEVILTALNYDIDNITQRINKMKNNKKKLF